MVGIIMLLETTAVPYLTILYSPEQWNGSSTGLRLQIDSSVTKCMILRRGNRPKENFVQLIAVFCLKDLGAVLQKIPLAVCVCVHEIWHSAST